MVQHIQKKLFKNPVGLSGCSNVLRRVVSVYFTRCLIIITWSLCTADIETTFQTLTTACPMWPHPWLRHSVNVGAEENMRAAKHKNIHAGYRGPSLAHGPGPSGGPDLGESGHRGWVTMGGLSCLGLSRVGNSKSSNLASQAARTSGATRIGSEDILLG